MLDGAVGEVEAWARRIFVAELEAAGREAQGRIVLAVDLGLVVGRHAQARRRDAQAAVAEADGIGRASCRERVEISVVAVSLNKNREQDPGEDRSLVGSRM